MTIVATSMRHMIQNGARQEIQTQHCLGLISVLNSQVLVNIFCNSTSYCKIFLSVSRQYNVTQCEGMSMNRKGAFETAGSVFIRV